MQFLSHYISGLVDGNLFSFKLHVTYNSKIQSNYENGRQVDRSYSQQEINIKFLFIDDDAFLNPNFQGLYKLRWKEMINWS